MLRVLVRIGLCLTIISMMIFADRLPIDGKGMGMRLPAYFAVVLFGAWLVQKRQYSVKSRKAEWCLLIALWIDVVGNLFRKYHEWLIYDDVAHFVIVGLLVISITGFFLNFEKMSYPVLTLVGLGALLATSWEIVEWWNLQIGIRNLQLSYNDTITDLIFSIAGGFAAAVVLKKWPKLFE